jgi:uncharacterized membrane protein
MNIYLGIKLLHIVSATILFGTGLGTAFFMFQAYRGGRDEAMKSTTQTVVLADWLFTTPAVIVQVVSGIWLTQRLGIPFTSVWFITVIALFCLVGACWLPVVWIQIRIRQLFRAWIALGVPAFTAVLALFWLMVYKPGISQHW